MCNFIKLEIRNTTTYEFNYNLITTYADQTFVIG